MPRVSMMVGVNPFAVRPVHNNAWYYHRDNWASVSTKLGLENKRLVQLFHPLSLSDRVVVAARSQVHACWGVRILVPPRPGSWV